jgi:hypothetical protein
MLIELNQITVASLWLGLGQRAAYYSRPKILRIWHKLSLADTSLWLTE